jgi:hypothetical protein
MSAADSIAVFARRPAPTVQPGCEDRALRPWPALVGPGEVAGVPAGPWPAGAMHVGFFDNRRHVDVGLFGRVIELARRVETSSAPIVPHALLFSRPRAALPPGFVLHLLAPFAEPSGSATLAQCLVEALRRLCHGPGGNFVWKPLVHLLLPASIDRLLLLDTDVVVIRPLSQLWAMFADFGPEAVVGVGPEQSNLYEQTSGWRMQGRNGGVQLLHLDRMRASPKYNAQLDRYGSGQAGLQLGYLGDQTLYTLVAFESPELFYAVGCEWNRQLSSHFGFANASVHACARPCGLMHANDGRSKCIAWRMQAEGATCGAWHQMVERASTRPANETCPDLGASHARTWQQAMKGFFGDCCVP